MKWDNTLVERNALVDTVIQAFKKYGGRSNYKDSGIELKLKWVKQAQVLILNVTKLQRR